MQVGEIRRVRVAGQLVPPMYVGYRLPGRVNSGPVEYIELYEAMWPTFNTAGSQARLHACLPRAAQPPQLTSYPVLRRSAAAHRESVPSIAMPCRNAVTQRCATCRHAAPRAPVMRRRARETRDACRRVVSLSGCRTSSWTA
jgi:hypothetical protein